MGACYSNTILMAKKASDNLNTVTRTRRYVPVNKIEIPEEDDFDEELNKIEDEHI